MSYIRFGASNDPCADPYSEECEDKHCPHWWSSEYYTGSDECKKYLSDKKAGLLTSVKQLQTAKKIRKDVSLAIEERRKGEIARQQTMSARAEAEKAWAETEAARVAQGKLRTKLEKNKKLVIIGAGVLSLLAVGAFFLGRKR